VVANEEVRAENQGKQAAQEQEKDLAVLRQARWVSKDSGMEGGKAGRDSGVEQ